MDLNISGQRKIAVLTIISFLLGATGTYAIFELDMSGQQKAQELVTVLENQTGQDLELVNHEKENGLYRVDVRNSENQLLTYHMSSDGEMFSQNMMDKQEVKQATRARNDFRSCLEQNNVVLYGNVTQQATQLQIQALGGTQTVSNIFKDINSQQVLQEAVNRGVQNVPSFYQDGETLQGVNQLSQVEQFTGCEYSTE